MRFNRTKNSIKHRQKKQNSSKNVWHQSGVNVTTRWENIFSRFFPGYAQHIKWCKSVAFSRPSRCRWRPFRKFLCERVVRGSGKMPHQKICLQNVKLFIIIKPLNASVSGAEQLIACHRQNDVEIELQNLICQLSQLTQKTFPIHCPLLKLLYGKQNIKSERSRCRKDLPLACVLRGCEPQTSANFSTR